MKKVISAIFITILIVLAGFLIWVRYAADHTHIQPLLARSLGPEFRVEMNSASIHPLQRSISIGQFTITAVADDRIIFKTDTLHISGINPRIIFRKDISISVVEMNSFTIDWDHSLADGNGDSEDNDSIRRLAVQTIDLANGTIILRRKGEISSRMNGFNLLGGFDFSAEADSLDLSPNRIFIDSLGFLVSEDRYRFTVSDFDYEQLDGRLTLAFMKLAPVGGYFQFMNSLTYDAHMYEIIIENFTASEIDAESYLKHQIVKAGYLDFDAFSIHVAKDKGLPEKPDKKDPVLLNKTIQNLPFAVQFDSLYLRNTNIRYSEQDENGIRPGTVSFMNSTIHIRDVNSLSSSPVNLKASTFLQNHAELKTELNFTVHDGPFHMTGTGKLQPFDLTELNAIFMDLEGIEIVSGQAHELNFDFEMIDDSSSGRMHLVYENLKMRIVDKEDHSRSFSRAVKGFITNNFVLRTENMPDSRNQVRTGVIDHARRPGGPFFQHLWQTLRSGIYDIVLKI